MNPVTRILVLVALLVLAGCKTPPRGERVHPAPERVGVIVLVNEEQRFVLIDTTTGVIPGAGTALKVFRNEAEVAVLHAGEVQRRPFVIADFVTGQPARGDVVFR